MAQSGSETMWLRTRTYRKRQLRLTGIVLARMSTRRFRTYDCSPEPAFLLLCRILRKFSVVVTSWTTLVGWQRVFTLLFVKKGPLISATGFRSL